MQKIQVTSSSIPSEKSLIKKINTIYHTKRLTTNGPLLKNLENKLKNFLKVKHIVLLSNCTMGLQVAYKTLGVKKGILTSPFNYISASNAADWLNIKVFFSDIDKDSLNLDYKKISKKILNKVECIVPVNSFGIPCNFKKIKKISNNKKIIYDAAHCFDLKYNRKSMLTQGDASVISFHATKVFNTCEGGAIVFKKKKDMNIAKQLIQIGFNTNDYKKDNSKLIAKQGINLKMSELQAAWGLALLERYSKIKSRRKLRFNKYLKFLKAEIFIPNKNLKSNNYSYLPVIFKSEIHLIKCLKKLAEKKIFPRRYFYPSLNKINHFKTKIKCPVSESISKKILCLPLSEELSLNKIKLISKTVNSFF